MVQDDSRPVQRWYQFNLRLQFSLRFVFLLFVLAAVLMSWYAVERDARRARVLYRAWARYKDGVLEIDVRRTLNAENLADIVEAKQAHAAEELRLLGPDVSGLYKESVLTPDACRYLGRLRLKVLRIERVTLDDEAVGHLADLSKLQELQLVDTGAGPAAIDGLMRALPRCLVAVE